MWRKRLTEIFLTKETWIVLVENKTYCNDDG